VRVGQSHFPRDYSDVVMRRIKEPFSGKQTHRIRGPDKVCLRPQHQRIKTERASLLSRKGQQGNVYQAHQRGKWDPRSPAYGRFWIDVPGGERQRRTVSLGPCATQWVARLRLREYIERAGGGRRRESVFVGRQIQGDDQPGCLPVSSSSAGPNVGRYLPKFNSKSLGTP
jgi:hypothetical protein